MDGLGLDYAVMSQAPKELNLEGWSGHDDGGETINEEHVGRVRPAAGVAI
jgi:hypothetical protein